MRVEAAQNCRTKEGEEEVDWVSAKTSWPNFTTPSADLTEEMMVNFGSQSDLTSIFHIYFGFVLDSPRHWQNIATLRARKLWERCFKPGQSNLRHFLFGFSACGESFSLGSWMYLNVKFQMFVARKVRGGLVLINLLPWKSNYDGFADSSKEELLHSFHRVKLRDVGFPLKLEYLFEITALWPCFTTLLKSFVYDKSQSLAIPKKRISLGIVDLKVSLR